MRYLKVCTKEKPYSGIAEENVYWQHPDAEEIEEDYGKSGGVADGDYVKYKCPICGHEFWNELPN